MPLPSGSERERVSADNRKAEGRTGFGKLQVNYVSVVVSACVVQNGSSCFCSDREDSCGFSQATNSVRLKASFYQLVALTTQTRLTEQPETHQTITIILS
ncbi:hypothetical protein ILYODFUR_005286 [Ilyodon furcidens]|uniref:Uncharacterized protein n=1 Tax=Ilyodon furcidens TaxID=33524 RepID=A0ABV0TS46_9TELE